MQIQEMLKACRKNIILQTPIPKGFSFDSSKSYQNTERMAWQIGQL